MGAAPVCRPAAVCAALLAALDASEGRSRRRKRDQTPDRIGLAIKRDLLAGAVRDDPEPAAFEGWLLDQCLAAEGGPSVGAVRALARDVLHEWRLAGPLAILRSVARQRGAVGRRRLTLSIVRRRTASRAPSPE